MFDFIALNVACYFGIIRSYMSTISLIDVYYLDSRHLLAVSGFLDTAQDFRDI